MAQKWRKSLIKKSQRTHYNKNTAFRSEATLPLHGGGRGVGQTQGACRNRQATVRKKQVSLPAFFVPPRGQFYEPLLRDLDLILKLKNNSQMISND